MNPLNISELTSYGDSSNLNSTDYITKKIKITNNSSEHIDNIKLTIDTSKLPVLSQTIIRDRGSLGFDPSIPLIELGNLSPQESLYIEYKIPSSNLSSSLLSCISISFNKLHKG